MVLVLPRSQSRGEGELLHPFSVVGGHSVLDPNGATCWSQFLRTLGLTSDVKRCFGCEIQRGFPLTRGVCLWVPTFGAKWPRPTDHD